MAETVVSAVTGKLNQACNDIQNEFAEELKRTVRIAADVMNLEHRSYMNSHNIERVKETQDWVHSVQQAIDESNKTFKPTMSGDEIHIYAGLGSAVEPYIKERSAVIQDGNTDGAHSLTTKPGQEVWNHDLSGKVMSKSKSVHEVLNYMKIFPEDGQKYIQDAEENMVHKAQDILGAALADFIPQAMTDALNDLVKHR